MIHNRLQHELDRVAARLRYLRFWQVLALTWITAAALGGGLVAWKLYAGLPTPVTLSVLLVVTLILAGLAVGFALRSARDYEWVARQIESAYPELRTCLLVAVEQRPDLPGGRFGYLQASVIHEALQHARRHEWEEIVPPRKLALAMLANVPALALWGLALAGAMATVAGATGGAPLIPGGGDVLAGQATMTIEPGDTEVERGTSLLVLAQFAGPMPSSASLVTVNESGEVARLAMSASLDDPVFGGRIHAIEEPLEYFVEAGSATSPKYRVQVFEYPRLERADAELAYPAYTGLESRLVQDVRTVSVVEGTQVSLHFHLNKPVASATLIDVRDHNAQAEPIVLTASSEDPRHYVATIEARESRRLQLQLIDEAQRANVKPAHFTINVRANLPPSLKPVFPARDLEVSALEEIDVRATAFDDFGLQRIGITYALGGQEPVDVVLAEKAAGKERHEVAHILRLEDLGAEVDQLLTYHWWAEDVGSDGQVRRTMSDMYFAEVRPFEEIFRQGEQPPGGEQQQQRQQNQQQGKGQNAQDAQELAKLQKDIINATWKLIRREIGAQVSDRFLADAEQVRLSQVAARAQAEELAERLQDEQSKEHIDAVLEQMQEAIDQLTKAQEGLVAPPLTPALAAEQQAYQSLLRLRAREHEVVRQQQQQQQGQQGAQQSASRSQQQRQQLQQLDLQNEENRYETQRMAQEQQQESPQDRENRQVLNRLRELARRQHDLNERLKELQNALEEAATEEEKEEVQGQLKRLQDEQRQILQDTDELQSRMEQPENLERMTDEREQLEQTREQVRRASESLEQQQVSQAAASGTRAEQQFDELREEFRRRAANRFSQEMQEMREAARELERREEAITQQLNGQNEERQGPPSLREENARDDVARELQEQRQRLQNLQERMRNTIEAAEETEPLLSQRLYDTARDLQQRRVDDALTAAERSLRQGLAEDARQQESRASEGIRQAREGIERAAESVLGDSTEGLRRAREELRELAQELNDEIERNALKASDRQSAGGQRENGRSGQSREAGQEGEPQSRGDSSDSQQESPSDRGEGTRGREPGDDEERTRRGDSRDEESPDQQEERSDRQPGQRGEGQRGARGEDDQSEEQGEEERDGNREGSGGQPGAGRRGQPPSGDRDEQRDTNGEPRNERQREGEEPNGEQREGEQPGQGEAGAPRSGQRDGRLRGDRRQGRTLASGTTGPFEDYVPQEAAPLTGEGFREWSDRLRDVEEMVDDPDLRGEAARVRERARAIRIELKRHSAPPNWDIVREQVAEPLVELQERISEELLRRTSKKALVPLDRDPVPPEYAEQTRRYYERLGSGQ